MDLEFIIKIVKNKIKTFVSAEDYYYYKQDNNNNNNEIINVYTNGKINTFKTNNNSFVYTNYFKILVDQKIDYLLAKEPTNDILPDEFDIVELFDHASLISSLDAVAWVHTYVQNNRLQWDIVRDNEIVAIYADRLKRKLEKVIRFYALEKTIKIEVWDTENVTFFEVSKDKFGVINDSLFQTKHYADVTKYPNSNEVEKIEYNSFNYIPFIPIYNNKCKTDDLDNIKQLIDYYNEISSGFIDNIFKFQEFLLILEGVGGQDLDVLMTELKKHKTLQLPMDSKANYLSVDIPVEARSVVLNILKNNIFLLGRGVDLKDLRAAGSNITNTLIKAMYADLDMKANDTEKQYKIFYRQLINQINSFYNTNIDNNITFNRTMLYNETEKVQACKESLGIISLYTTLKNHPFVIDVDDELELIKQENEIELIKQANEIRQEHEIKQDNEIKQENEINDKSKDIIK